jgi:transposase
MSETDRVVTGGVDTHKQFHVAAVCDQAGRILATSSFQTTAAGYRALLRWMRSFGPVGRVGVEGTGAYGAGLNRFLTASGVEAVEVNRPNRQARRRRGKNDTVDAEAAARAALNGEASVAPKSQDGIVESVRVIRVAFCSARAHRTQVSNQMRDLILTAPDQLRCDLEPMNAAQRVQRCVRFRPGELADPLEGTRLALRTLARRYQDLTTELDELRHHLDVLTNHANPALRAAPGVGSDVASILLIATGDNYERITSDAAFAALCGVSPIEASSGQTTRYRLNRGGNRQANHALWRIAMVRLSTDPRTQAYAARRRAEGKTTRDILRCLKRYIAREIYTLLLHPEITAAPGPELKAQRLAAGLTQLEVATALGTDQSRISEIEHNRRPNQQLTIRYRTWLDSTCAA